MRFFIDTANLGEIRAAMEMGLVDGVTTNPSLMAREASDWREIAREICQLVPGPVSLEVIALDAEGMGCADDDVLAVLGTRRML